MSIKQSHGTQSDGNHTKGDAWINILLALNIMIKCGTQEIESIKRSNKTQQIENIGGSNIYTDGRSSVITLVISFALLLGRAILFTINSISQKKYTNCIEQEKALISKTGGKQNLTTDGSKKKMIGCSEMILSLKSCFRVNLMKISKNILYT